MKNHRKKKNLLTFDSLYREYFNHIYRFSHSLMGNPEEADDITQETFIKLYRQLESGEETRNPKAWIYRVAANSCYNHLKRKKLSRIILAKENFPPDIAPGNIEEDMMKQQEIYLLRSAIRKLPARDQVILTLYKNGFSTTEIAETIKVKKNSIGKILARSVEKLSKVIKKGDAR